VLSVVINNFNYGDFLADAIESSLAQRGVESEVIVVDDGSTDASRETIRRYEGRLRAILKENAGQGSAFNAGFQASQGDIVIFLDADDMLLPGTAASIDELFGRRPDIVKAHFRLAVVDEHGRATGDYVPPLTQDLPDGDIRARALTAPDDVPYPPTSGNAFSAAALRRLLPMPEQPYTRLADVYLLNLAPLLGPVGHLDLVGGHYRLHTRNVHHTTEFDLERIRATIRVTETTHRHLRELASSLGLAGDGDVRLASVTDLAQRLLSQRLDPKSHPIHADRTASLAISGTGAALRRSDAPFVRRVLYVAWFLAVAVTPRLIVRRLGERMFAAWRIASLRAPPSSQ
jgi:hypothetical protein